MSGSFKDDGTLDIGDGRIILCVGKKRSGKSVLGKLLADGAPSLGIHGYPGDLVVIDVAGDDGPSQGEDVHELHGTAEDLPRRWPEHLRKDDGRMVLRYVPDPGSPTFAEDMDAVVGLAMHHARAQKHDKGRGACLLIHEIGVVAPANQTQPHMRRALMHNRHNGLTLIMCGPRPMVVDPLVVQQSDVIYTFELLNPADRKRLAESMGWHPEDFSEALSRIKKHGYVRFDANEDAPDEDAEEDHRVVIVPPLPEDVVRAVRK